MMKRTVFSKKPAKSSKAAVKRTPPRKKGKTSPKVKKQVKKRVVATKRAVRQLHGTITVQRMFPDKTMQTTEGKIRVGAFVVEPARVGISYGITLNMTNYQFARATVSVELPCHVEEKDAALAACERIVSKQIQKEIDSLDAQRKKYGLKPAEIVGEPEPLITFLK